MHRCGGRNSRWRMQQRRRLRHRDQICLSIFLSVIGLLCVIAGCNRTPAAQSKVPTKLVISGDTSSWITPCGCTTNQSGGLLRRGTYLKQLAGQGQVIYADVGGAVSGNSEYQRMKLEAILRGEIAMGVAAHNIGGAEAS